MSWHSSVRIRPSHFGIRERVALDPAMRSRRRRDRDIYGVGSGMKFHIRF
ncbi:hypothetical protein HMPREF0043_00690 [Actinobaculum sp. oral taxon 183 str. F0552]|nr:hypothetical protein HMPREF0043_00690 [Actinobaculum sp. oral taxon 183 str. F0552]